MEILRPSVRALNCRRQSSSTGHDQRVHRTQEVVDGATSRLVVVLAIGAGAAFGDLLTEELEFTAGGLTAIIQNNNYQGSCVGNGCGSIYYGGIDEGMAIAGSIDGWQFAALDTGPNLFATALTCVGDGCTSDPLHVIYSDINFTESNALFFYAQTGPPELGCGPFFFLPPYNGPNPYNCSGGVPGGSSANAYYDAGNTLFAETSPIDNIALPPSAPYSLTVDETFDSNFPRGTVTLVSATLTTPEPSAVVLLATVLALCAWRFRAVGSSAAR